MPEHDLGNAKELVAKFEAEHQARHEGKDNQWTQ